MRLEDALFNWLQIKLVSDARPADEAAHNTRRFFEQILTEDHEVTAFSVAARDETMIQVRYEKGGASKLQFYSRDAVEQLLADIEANPKYN